MDVAEIVRERPPHQAFYVFENKGLRLSFSQEGRLVDAIPSVRSEIGTIRRHGAAPRQFYLLRDVEPYSIITAARGGA
jgi:hypothetical protein